MAEPLQIDGIAIHIEGPPEAADTVVMIHGWPDTHRLWDRTVAALKDQHRCVRFTLPGFDNARPRDPRSVQQLVEFFARVIESTCPGQPVTLLVHDWGAVFGYQFAMRRPDLVARVIGVDVGDANSPQHLKSLSNKAKLGIAGYQWWLLLAWRLGALIPSLGDGMTRRMARALRCPAPQALICSGMCYPYDIAWLGSHGGLKRLAPVALTQPMLFIYGTRKPFMFHSQTWADGLAARPGCQVVALRTGHWVMDNDPAGFIDAVRAWLDATPSRVAPTP